MISQDPAPLAVTRCGIPRDTGASPLLQSALTLRCTMPCAVIWRVILGTEKRRKQLAKSYCQCFKPLYTLIWSPITRKILRCTMFPGSGRAADVSEGIKRGVLHFFFFPTISTCCKERGRRRIWQQEGMLGSCFSRGKHRKTAATDPLLTSLLTFWDEIITY